MIAIARKQEQRKRRKRTYKRMTARHILRRISMGTLLVDVFEGCVYVRRSPSHDYRELRVDFDRRGRAFVRLYYRGRRCGIMRARLVWMAAHRRPVPRGHEVHHKDRDRENDCWSNLECKRRFEHQEFHRAF